MNWPWIKTSAPASPYGQQGGQLFDSGDARARSPMHPGQYPLPFNPYSLRYLALRAFNPNAPTTRAVAATVPVSLRGNGLQLTGAIYYQPLIEQSTRSGILT